MIKTYQPKRYQVMYPTDGDGTIIQPGSFDDLEDAGRCYLNTPGASDIWDRQEKRYIHPEQEIDCVADAYHRWWWSQASLRHRVEHVLMNLLLIRWWRRYCG